MMAGCVVISPRFDVGVKDIEGQIVWSQIYLGDLMYVVVVFFYDHHKLCFPNFSFPFLLMWLLLFLCVDVSALLIRQTNCVSDQDFFRAVASWYVSVALSRRVVSICREMTL